MDSYLGLMPTLFTLEDRYGLTIESGENGVSPRVDPRKGKDAAEFSEMLNAWAEQPEKLRNGDISREDYDKWRYNYPKYDETSGYVKVPSQQLSDAMVEAFKDRLNGVNARMGVRIVFWTVLDYRLVVVSVLFYGYSEAYWVLFRLLYGGQLVDPCLIIAGDYLARGSVSERFV